MSPQNSHRIWRQAPQGGVSGIGIRRDGDPPELAHALGDGFEDGDALRAQRQPVGRVFDVAAGVHAAGGIFERRAHAEMRIRRVRVFAGRQRGGRQRIGHVVRSNASRSCSYSDGVSR